MRSVERGSHIAESIMTDVVSVHATTVGRK